MAAIRTIHGRTLDGERFYQQALATARATLASVQDSARDGALRQVARETLQEAHSALGQQDFFACVDALGGQQALITRLVADLERRNA